jgi:Ion channel
VRRLWDLPLWWGLVYLGLIPVFASVYAWQPPRSFYDPNMRREEAIRDDAANLRNSLTDGLKPVVWKEHGYTVEAEAPRVEAIEQTQNGHFLLAVAGGYENLGRQFRVAGFFNVWVEVLFREGTLTIRPNGHPKIALSVALTRPGQGSEEEPKPSRVGPSVSRLFPSLPGTFGGEPSRGTLVISRDTYDQLENFRVATEGDPSLASGEWWRMAYLSVVIITTLGFGDITPLTETARTLVALEAIIGVVVIGLFLNALARRLRGPAD